MVAEPFNKAVEDADMVVWGSTRSVRRRGKSRQVDDKMVAFLSEPAHEADEEQMVAEALFDLANMGTGIQTKSEDGSGKRSLDQDAEVSGDEAVNGDESMLEDQEHHGPHGMRRARGSAKRLRGSSRHAATDQQPVRTARGGPMQQDAQYELEQGKGGDGVRGGAGRAPQAQGAATTDAAQAWPGSQFGQQQQFGQQGPPQAQHAPNTSQPAHGTAQGPPQGLPMPMDPATATAMAMRSMAHLLPPGMAAKLPMLLNGATSMPMAFPPGAMLGPGGLPLVLPPWAAAALQNQTRPPFLPPPLGKLVQGSAGVSTGPAPDATVPALGLPQGGFPTPQMMLAAAAAGLPAAQLAATAARAREGGAEAPGSAAGVPLAAAAPGMGGGAGEPAKPAPAVAEESRGDAFGRARGGAGSRGDQVQAPAVGQPAAIAVTGQPSGYKRCALHVYIAHFIAGKQAEAAQQQQGPQQAQAQRQGQSNGAGVEGTTGLEQQQRAAGGATAAVPAQGDGTAAAAGQQVGGVIESAGQQLPNADVASDPQAQGPAHHHTGHTGPGSEWGSHSDEEGEAAGGKQQGQGPAAGPAAGPDAAAAAAAAAVVAQAREGPEQPAAAQLQQQPAVAQQQQQLLQHPQAAPGTPRGSAPVSSMSMAGQQGQVGVGPGPMPGLPFSWPMMMHGQMGGEGQQLPNMPPGLMMSGPNAAAAGAAMGGAPGMQMPRPPAGLPGFLNMAALMSAGAPLAFLPLGAALQQQAGSMGRHPPPGLNPAQGTPTPFPMAPPNGMGAFPAAGISMGQLQALMASNLANSFAGAQSGGPAAAALAAYMSAAGLPQQPGAGL